jgi:hypothetical protein
MTQTKSLDLGCGTKPKNFFEADIVYGIDVRDDLEKNIICADLAIENIPFESEYFNFVTAHDLLWRSTSQVHCLLLVPSNAQLNDVYWARSGHEKGFAANDRNWVVTGKSALRDRRAESCLSATGRIPAIDRKRS